MNPKTWLEKYRLEPRKSLGQNYLHDPNALEKIVSTADLMPEDTVVEIGAGTGALTEVLAQSAHYVHSIEIDKRMRPILDKVLARFTNVNMIYQDVLEVNLLELLGETPFVVVANVPYYITSQILRYVLDAPRRPRRVVLTVQYEVAERVCAKEGDMSLLALSVQLFGKPQLVSKLPPAVFWPRPDVDSAILRIDTYETPPVDVDSALLFRVAKAGFGQKRKQLKNSLASGLSLNGTETAHILAQAEIDVKRRAETLSLTEWGKLTHAYIELKKNQKP